MKHLLLATLLLMSCSPGAVVQEIALGEKIFKRDVKIVFEGREYRGVAVLPKRDTYNLELTFAGELDLVTFKSCHREVTQHDAGSGKIFGKKNKWVYVYTPVKTIEDGVCPVEIAGFEREKGRNSLANLDFETGLETLPSVVLCNGERTGYSGVSTCQSYEGLISRIIFQRPVNLVADPDCPSELKTLDKKSFELTVNAGRCIYSFRALDGDRAWHRLTTIGYQEIPIRSME